MPHAVIAAHPTHWRVMGRGARPALMLHCSLAHSGAWTGLSALLEDALTMTAPDLPGHGRSADWNGTPPLHGLATDIAAELAASLAHGAPVDVIGHSFGGTIALRLALERPDLVKSLTLIEPVFFAAARIANTPEYAETAKAQPEFDIAMAEGRHLDAARWFHSRWGMGTALDDMPEVQRNYMVDRISLIPAVNDVLLDDSAGLLVPGRLESLQVPVLLIEGGQSPVIIDAVNRTLASRIPGTQRLLVPGAGHMVPITHPTRIAGPILAHLGLGPDGGPAPVSDVSRTVRTPLA
ncbi:MAG: alpha/beta hydrolase [Gemmobacter sp.]|nr:alpha/beta hydrolase [Gemmobacter sp.]